MFWHSVKMFRKDCSIPSHKVSDLPRVAEIKGMRCFGNVLREGAF